jgi:hypothetical protein
MSPRGKRLWFPDGMEQFRRDIGYSTKAPTIGGDPHNSTCKAALCISSARIPSCTLTAP